MGDGRHRQGDGAGVVLGDIDVHGDSDVHGDGDVHGDRFGTPAALRRLHQAGVRAPGGWVPGRPQLLDQDARPEPPWAPAGADRSGTLWAREFWARCRGSVLDRLPAPLRAAAVAPVGRSLVGLAVLLGLAVVVAGVGMWLSRPTVESVPRRSGGAEAVPARHGVVPGPGAGAVESPLVPSSAATPSGPPIAVGVAPGGFSAGAGAPATGTVWVHVAGAVRHPGVVRLRAGSRVADAVEAAGGPTRSARTASVNLARPVEDGEQVVVLRRGARPVEAVPPAPLGAAPAAGGSVPGTSQGPVDLNAASLDQLDALPGIGPVLAQRILDWRTSNGRFSAVEELAEVSGIGEATLADLLPLVTV